ncbi:MAG: alpha/beta hydrolase [Saprospiraceae bacterium]|nr:alpha/beta hydrolase [Saprospiraceae bacterium]MCB0573700.1 alpha/beta hydrolase [Saprospiraceae bacterium]MCB9353188.1 alpha/beta hydrolase [Lewinellaceae bacterium]
MIALFYRKDSDNKMPSSLSVFLQKKALFRPTTLAADASFHFSEPFEEQYFTTADGERLHSLFFPTRSGRACGVVLYFHGNRDNLRRWGAMHRDFTPLGYDFLAPDYRGYGKSTGEPDEQHYYKDALLIYKWLRKKYLPEEIVLYGRSLGTAMATYLAARAEARMLVLETPFDNIQGLLSSHLRSNEPPFEPAFRFPNDRYLREARLPVLIFHGTRDRVVPYASAANLKPLLKPGDEFVTIDGGSHNNLGEYQEYREHLQRWLRQ